MWSAGVRYNGFRSYRSEPVHALTHLTLNRPGSDVNPTPDNFRVPAVAENALSLASWFVAASKRTPVACRRRPDVSDAIVTAPVVCTVDLFSEYSPPGAVSVPSGLPNAVVNWISIFRKRNRVSASYDDTVSPVTVPRRTPFAVMIVLA